VADETEMKAPILFTIMNMYTAPQDAILTSMRRTGATGRFWHHKTATMQKFGESPFHALGRIDAREKGRGVIPRPLETLPSTKIRQRTPVESAACPCSSSRYSSHFRVYRYRTGAMQFSEHSVQANVA
jgi:hypothetical protein